LLWRRPGQRWRRLVDGPVSGVFSPNPGAGQRRLARPGSGYGVVETVPQGDTEGRNMRVRSAVPVDVGTVNALVHAERRGLVLDEPSAVAVVKDSSRLADAGTAADRVAGREAKGVEVVRPLSRWSPQPQGARAILNIASGDWAEDISSGGGRP
jgi:MreB/Mbl protein